VWIGTCLNADDQAAVRVVVGPYSVEMHCAGTRIEMDPDSLAVFIAIVEQALPQLDGDTDQPPTTPVVGATGVTMVDDVSARRQVRGSCATPRSNPGT
jgi:hypothetical protein